MNTLTAFFQRQPICAVAGIWMGAIVGFLLVMHRMSHPNAAWSTSDFIYAWLALSALAAAFVLFLLFVQLRPAGLHLSLLRGGVSVLMSAFIITLLTLLVSVFAAQALSPLLTLFGSLIGWLIGRALCRDCDTRLASTAANGQKGNVV